MWKRCREVLLRNTLNAAIFLIVYPVVVILRIHWFNGDGGLAGMLVGLAMLAAGCITAGGVSRITGRMVWIYCAFAVGLTISVLWLGWSFSAEGFSRMIFEMAAAAGCYSLGFFAYFSCIRATFFAKTGLPVFAVLYAISVMSGTGLYRKPYFYTFLYMFILCLLVLKNQENLEFVIKRRGVNLPEVTKGLRKFNAFSIALAYAAVLFIFNFHSIVVFALEILGKIFKWAAGVVLYILKLLMRHKGGTYEEYFGFEPFDPRPSPYPLVILLFNTVIYFILLFSLYKLIPVGLRKVKEFYRVMLDFINRLLSARLGKGERGGEEYKDVVEYGRLPERKRKHGAEKNQIGALMKQLKGTDDPGARIRMMYRIVLCLLSGKKGIEIRPSDTTGEIMGKAAEVETLAAAMRSFTKVYDGVRYGEKNPGTDIVEAERDYQEIESTLISKEKR